MIRPALDRLRDIDDTIVKLLNATAKHTRDDLSADWLFAQGCERAIIIIAEAANKLPADVCARAPEIPWADIVAMGNLLKHEYFRIDSDVVWLTLTTHLPRLHTIIRRLLAETEQPGLPL